MESAGAGSVSRSSSVPNIKLIESCGIITMAWVYYNAHICESHILLITNTPDRSLTWCIFQVRRSIFQVPPRGVAWVVPCSQEWLRGAGRLNSLKSARLPRAMGIPMTHQTGAITTKTAPSSSCVCNS